MAPQSTPYPLQLAVLAVVYFVLAKASLALALPPGYATAVWPPAGVGLAALWLRGLGLWPGVWLGAAAAHYTIEGSLVAALAHGTGAALEALAGAALARRFLADRRGPFSQPRYVVRLFLCTLVAATIAATAGVAELAASGTLESGSAAANWLTWWLGDATGMMIIAPLIVSWTRPGRVTWSAARIAEGVLLFAALALTAGEIFAGRLFGADSAPLPYLLLPFVMWAAIRFGGREAVTACALVSAIALAATVSGSGPFAGRDLNVSLLMQQAFVATLVAVGLTLAGLMRQLSRLVETKRRAQEEMERIIQLAAHDLQEPVRNVINFSDLLRLRHGARLDPEALEYLGFIAAGAAQSRRLIDDLLQLLEAGRRPLELERASAGAALGAALESLQGAIDAAGAAVSHGPLPELRADRRMLQSVFRNLIGNAIRYRSREAPRVEVSARLDGARWIVSVADNGSGVDPKHQAAVLEMLGRTGQLTFPDLRAAGIGLALCKRIVERHGGRIWLESPLAGGSVFRFSLPAEEGSARGTA
jgi:signal transduction histidine kinase